MQVARAIHRALVLPTLLMALSCDSPAGPPQDLPITSLLRPGIGAFSEPRRLVIRSQSEWEEIWKALAGTGLLPPSRPEVDFSRDMVIIAAAGQQPSTGFSIAVESAVGTRRTATVRVRAVSPGANCVVAWMITAPMDIVRLPAREHVRFEEVSEHRPCG